MSGPLQIPGATFGAPDLLILVLNLLVFVGIVWGVLTLLRRFTGRADPKIEELERHVEELESEHE